MKLLSIDHILELHQKMISATGGTFGIRDIKLLQSAINNSLATFDGKELYPDIESKTAAICYSIINNHPFIDGNKRMGIFIMLILLEYNNYKIKYSQSELIDLGLSIAKGNYKTKDIIEWIKNHKI